jgi:hypothetical protein
MTMSMAPHPGLAGIFEDDRLVQSVFHLDWQETQLQVHSGVRAVLVSFFMRDFSCSDIFQQAVGSATLKPTAFTFFTLSSLSCVRLEPLAVVLRVRALRRAASRVPKVLCF